MLVDAMYCLGYRGFREGMFFPLLFTIDHTINQHFNMFASNGNKEILISNLDRDQIKDEVFSTIKKFGDMLNPEEPWFDKTGNPEMILAIPILLKLWPESVFVFAKRRAIENREWCGLARMGSASLSFADDPKHANRGLRVDRQLAPAQASVPDSG